MSVSPDYERAIALAACLFPDPDEWGANPEYLRGMCELIGGMFPEFTAGDANAVRVDIVEHLRAHSVTA